MYVRACTYVHTTDSSDEQLSTVQVQGREADAKGQTMAKPNFNQCVHIYVCTYLNKCACVFVNVYACIVFYIVGASYAICIL